MTTDSIHCHDEIKKKSSNICFLELSEEFRIDSKIKFELAMVNKPSMFELLRFHYI